MDTRRKTVKLGKKFAGSLATRLDAHPQSADGERAEDERKILSLMKDVFSKPEPDPAAVNFITHAVEVHTATHGFSKVIYDELFRLHQARVKVSEPQPAEPEKPKVKPAMPTTPRITANSSPDAWKFRRALKA